MFVDVHRRPWRTVKVTESRAAVDFAACMRDLVDVHFPAAERIRLVLDNLSTHSPGALYQAFPAQEARRVLRRLEFHYVPKHASRLNMVEIEIGVLAAQCLNRCIASIAQLAGETALWEQQRNAAGARIKWMFTTEKASTKMRRAYPQPQANSGHIQRVKTSAERYSGSRDARAVLDSGELGPCSAAPDQNFPNIVKASEALWGWTERKISRRR